MAEWTAQIAVDEDLARRLVGGQFPELALDSLVHLAEGWDNTVWLVDGAWAFRFPRREVAVPLVERELAVLPRLERRIRVPIPTPVFRGEPTDSYPWPFTGCPFLRGVELGSAQLTEGAERRLATAVGSFLRELHGSETAAAVSDLDLPIDPNGRADMSRRVPIARRHLSGVEERGIWQPPRLVEEVLASASDLPPPRATALVHGDLHFRHVLASDGDLSGVIDWGDVCLADASLDLLLLWSFSAPAREAYLDALGPVTEEQLLRARVVALSISAVLASYGRDESRPDIERAALACLERASEG